MICQTRRNGSLKFRSWWSCRAVAGGCTAGTCSHWTPDPRDEYHSALYEGTAVPNPRTGRTTTHRCQHQPQGPGTGVVWGPDEYWGPSRELGEPKNNVEHSHGSWWPKMEDLLEAEIPCYRFIRSGRGAGLGWTRDAFTGCRPPDGATTWPGTPASTYRQFTAAIHRYKWNKTQRYQSCWAMVFTNLEYGAQHPCHGHQPLQRHGGPCCSLSNKLSSCRCSPRREISRFSSSGHGMNEPVNYCMICRGVHIHTSSWRGARKKKNVVHCLRCVDKSARISGWICLEKYDIEELKTVSRQLFVLGDYRSPPFAGEPLHSLSQQQLLWQTTRSRFSLLPNLWTGEQQLLNMRPGVPLVHSRFTVIHLASYNYFSISTAGLC